MTGSDAPAGSKDAPPIPRQAENLNSTDQNQNPNNNNTTSQAAPATSSAANPPFTLDSRFAPRNDGPENFKRFSLVFQPCVETPNEDTDIHNFKSGFGRAIRNWLLTHGVRENSSNPECFCDIIHVAKTGLFKAFVHVKDTVYAAIQNSTTDAKEVELPDFGKVLIIFGDSRAVGLMDVLDVPPNWTEPMVHEALKVCGIFVVSAHRFEDPHSGFPKPTTWRVAFQSKESIKKCTVTFMVEAGGVLQLGLLPLRFSVDTPHILMTTDESGKLSFETLILNSEPRKSFVLVATLSAIRAKRTADSAQTKGTTTGGGAPAQATTEKPPRGRQASKSGKRTAGRSKSKASARTRRNDDPEPGSQQPQQQQQQQQQKEKRNKSKQTAATNPGLPQKQQDDISLRNKFGVLASQGNGTEGEDKEDGELGTDKPASNPETSQSQGALAGGVEGAPKASVPQTGNPPDHQAAAGGQEDQPDNGTAKQVNPTKRMTRSDTAAANNAPTNTPAVTGSDAATASQRGQLAAD